MDKFAKLINYAYFKSYDPKLPDKWNLLRRFGRKELSLDAQLKLEWIIFYHTISSANAKATAKHFGISRKTFHKWLGRFNETNLKTLEECSRAPKRKRDWMVTLKEEDNIYSLGRYYKDCLCQSVQKQYFRIRRGFS